MVLAGRYREFHSVYRVWGLLLQPREAAERASLRDHVPAPPDPLPAVQLIRLILAVAEEDWPSPVPSQAAAEGMLLLKAAVGAGFPLEHPNGIGLARFFGQWVQARRVHEEGVSPVVRDTVHQLIVLLENARIPDAWRAPLDAVAHAFPLLNTRRAAAALDGAIPVVPETLSAQRLSRPRL